MRFEIGPGGGIVILVGLLALSAAVFCLGMISEREMVQSEQSQSQFASVYTMPTGEPSASPPRAALPVEPPTAPLAAVTPEAPPLPAAVSENLPPAALPAPLAAARPEARPLPAAASDNLPPPALREPPLEPNAPPNPALASVPSPHKSAPAAEGPNDSSAAPAPSALSDKADIVPNKGAIASAPTPSAGTHRLEYKIEIDEIERAAADRMVSRLLSLGYTSQVVPSQIDGRTWYQVQVGPYRTSAAARAAQAKLQDAYNTRYIDSAGTGNAGTARAAAGAGNTGTVGAAAGTGAASAGLASVGSTNTHASQTGAPSAGAPSAGAASAGPMSADTSKTAAATTDSNSPSGEDSAPTAAPTK